MWFRGRFYRREDWFGRGNENLEKMTSISVLKKDELESQSGSGVGRICQ